jgi:AcrR family transcriptional regulator
LKLKSLQYAVYSCRFGHKEGVKPTAKTKAAQPRPGRQERRKAETKQKIVVAATKLFWSQGYDATSIHDITEAADVALGTFYLHFESKADVALIQFREWMTDFLGATESRPEDETPDRMLSAVLHTLGDGQYANRPQLRYPDGRPLPPVVMQILFNETALEISGRVYEILIEAEQTLASLFTRRLRYPDGSAEPQIIASAFVAAWRVAVYGFANIAAAGVDPPAPDELGVQAFTAYTKGLGGLWAPQRV